jgi:hypothetical protein
MIDKRFLIIKCSHTYMGVSTPIIITLKKGGKAVHITTDGVKS